MILANLRASAWKYASIVCAVLAVSAILGCLFLRGVAVNASLRADAAEQRAETAEGQVLALRDAAKRDAASDKASAEAIARMDAAAAETNDRLARLEGRLHDRPPVPDVCPDPDPVLMQELRAGADRIRAAGSDLRSLRNAEGPGPE